MKNNQAELTCQRLDYIKFLSNAANSRYKIIQIDEFNINRGTILNMAWIQKGCPVYILQESQVEKYCVLATISNTSIKRIFIRKGNINGAIFVTFLQDLINDLKLKYDEYFAKLIITWDEAKYHSVEEMMMVITAQYT